MAEPEDNKNEEDPKAGGNDDIQAQLNEAKARLAEFRENNINLKKQYETTTSKLEEFQDRFKDVDPDKYKRAMDALDRLEGDEEKRLVEEGKIDEVVNRRTSVMRDSFDSQVKAKDEALKARDHELGTLRSRLGQYEIHGAVQNAMDEAGIKPRPGALPDIYARADSVFDMDETGKLTTRDGHYGSDGNLMQPNEFVGQLMERANHLFEGGSGGGAEGGSSSRRKNAPTIDRNDPVAMGRNLEDIAKGKVQFE